MEELAWNAACLRLEDYLRAHAVEPRERLLALTLSILAEAKSAHAKAPGLSPLECTMRLASEKTDAWFSLLAGDPARSARARIAYFAGGRADLFLEWPLPDDFITSIRNAGIEAGPALEFQSLIRRELDYGAMQDIARETWERFSWGHVLSAFALWLAIFFAAWGIYLKFFQ